MRVGQKGVRYACVSMCNHIVYVCCRVWVSVSVCVCVRVSFFNSLSLFFSVSACCFLPLFPCLFIYLSLALSLSFSRSLSVCTRVYLFLRQNVMPRLHIVGYRMSCVVCVPVYSTSTPIYATPYVWTRADLYINFSFLPQHFTKNTEVLPDLLAFRVQMVLLDTRGPVALLVLQVGDRAKETMRKSGRKYKKGSGRGRVGRRRRVTFSIF